MKSLFVRLSIVVIVGTGGLTVSQSRSPADLVGNGKPDLVPILHSPMDGEIRVKNIGNRPAHPSKLILDCVRVGASDQMYSCPNLPISAAATYFDPAFPNNVTIKVPALAAGAGFVHKLSFWDTSNWPKGKYKFTVTVDAAHELVESDTTNNVVSTFLTIP